MKGGHVLKIIVTSIFILLAPIETFAVASPDEAVPGAIVTLIDYAEFPKNWKVRGNEERVGEIYKIRLDGENRVLSANITGEPIRIFKKVSWNPFTHPVLTWKWRVLKWPEEPGASVDFYVSLDRDFMGIPVIIKYLWSDTLPVGTHKKGGFFSGTKVVIRSGSGVPEEWATESLNVLESYRETYETEPAHEAVGIGLLVSPGVEMEISEISALPAENPLEQPE